MEQLQGMDMSFLSMERPHTPMHIGSVMIYDPSTAPGGFVRFKDILRFIDDRKHLSKTMRQKLVKVPLSIDYPYWMKDPDFDLEYHVRHIALPKPGDWRQLCIQAARIFARPLDLARPPWEMTVVEGLDAIEGVPKGSYAIVSKMHHAAIDGISGVDVMAATHTPYPSVAPPNEPDNWNPDKDPNKVRLFAKGYVRAWVNPVRQVGVVGRSVPGIYRAARGVMKGDFDIDAARRAPRTRFNGKVTPHRVFDGRTFKIKHISQMRQLAEGCKVNDVILAIVGGGLRKYLESKGELPESTMTAMAPISVRADAESKTAGNQVSAMVAPLGTHIADPVERLQYVFDQTKKSKAMTNALGARQMTEVSKSSPALFMALGAQLASSLGLATRLKPIMNTIVTNVPGPQVPLYSAGAELVAIDGMICLVDGIGLGHPIQSYRDKISVSFTACREMMPDP
ncbi:MAG: wax ester/triacylglycerol synthase family O-acyltransferase, partial [Pseudomonadota bacterium]